MAGTIELEIPSRNDYLALVRRLLSTANDLHRTLPDRRVDDLRLAVSEACSNSINAQRDQPDDAPVHITIDLDRASMTVTVTDHAGGFALDEVDPIPGAEEPGRLRHEHGLGLGLIRSLADTATFTATADGTAVRIEMRAAEPEAPAGLVDAHDG